MSKLKRIFIIFLSVLLAVVPAITLSSCASNQQTKENVFLIYYTNQKADDIIYKEEEIPDAASMEQVDLIEKLLLIMFTQNEDDTEYYTVCPENVSLQGITVKDGLITLDFNSAYKKMTNVREIIFRASVVLTLIQVPGISGVSFTVDGIPITDSNGENIGIMTKDRFVNVLLNEEGMLKQETNLNIYFANKAGDALVPVEYRFTLDNSNTSMEEYILHTLLEGPPKGVAYRTISKDVTINNVVTTDYVCYVNFGKDFLDQAQPVVDEVMIYSIVNSLVQLPYIYSVRFLVEGETMKTLHGSTDISVPFTWNEDIIEKTNQIQ